MSTKSINLIFAVGVFIFIYLTSLYNYLLFHSIAELFSIIIGFAIYLFSRNSRRFLENDYLIFLGIAYLFIGIIDLLHTFSYKGMGLFPGYDANLPTQLWISARYMESLSFLVAPVFLKRKISDRFYYIAYTLIAGVLLMTIFYWQVFPNCYIEEIGLTPFKKNSEYTISLILLASIGLLYINRREFDKNVYRLVVYSIVITIIAELAFTFYIGVYDFSNLIGHYFKIVSFYLVYKAIIETGFDKPYNLMFRNLKKSETELQEANHTKDTFFSIIAHDLKNPFQALISGTDFLSRNIHKFEKDTIKELMEQLNISAENTYDLLQNLLAWSQSQTGALNFKPQNIHLFDLVQDVISVLDYQAGAKGIQVRDNIGKEIRIFADSDMLETVIRNLISNGLKFTKPDGEVTINAKRTGGLVEISVSDTGVGIANNNLQNLFKIDKKQSAPGTEGEMGTGIGLILSKEFVQKNGGDMWVESTPNVGSKFTFSVPTARPDNKTY